MKADEARAVLYHFVAGVFKKLAKRERQHLNAGEIYECEVAVDGTVGRRSVSETLRGTVSVGADDPGAMQSTAPAADEVLAVLLSVLTPQTRKKALAQMPQKRAAFLKAAEALHERDDACYRAAEGIVRALTARRPTPKLGAVTTKYEAA